MTIYYQQTPSLCMQTKIKGIGRIYQFTAINAYYSFDFVYLYNDKSIKSSVDCISKATGILSYMGITVVRILYRYRQWQRVYYPLGQRDHLFEEYLKSKSIEHRYTKVKHPQTNRFVERFQRTILEKFYQPAILKKTYNTSENLQYDLNQLLYFYNF